MWISFLILPAVFGIYFFVSSFSDQFIKTQGIDYVAAQNNVLAQLYISGSLANFITRFMDFAFWGVLAAIFLLISWSFSVTKTSLQNRSIEQQFVNFQIPKKSWHSNLAAVLAIKTTSGILIIYFIIRIIINAIPMLSLGVSKFINHNGSVPYIFFAVFYLVLLQAVITALVSLFRITRSE